MAMEGDSGREFPADAHRDDSRAVRRYLREGGALDDAVASLFRSESSYILSPNRCESRSLNNDNLRMDHTKLRPMASEEVSQ